MTPLGRLFLIADDETFVFVCNLIGKRRLAIGLLHGATATYPQPNVPQSWRPLKAPFTTPAKK
jgi:hypothetical protein